MKRALFSGVVLVVVLVAACGWLANVLWWSQPRSDARMVAVTIAPNSAASYVAENLVAEKLIPFSALFVAYVRLTGTADDLKVGTFTLQQGTSVAEIVRILSSANRVERRITLLEGWGIKEMGEYLVAQGAIKNIQEWYTAVGTPPSVAGPKTQLGGSFSHPLVAEAIPPGHSREGFLFPDTYRIANDATAEDIAKTLLDNFQTRVEPDLVAHFKETGKGVDLYETVTLASIIEREVRSDEDRKIVADIFQRRLIEGMALQADSTVNYVTGNKTPSITSADRDIDSPWNTYQHRGLPPSPISNPSLSAIKAVLSPTPNTHVYFLTDAAGGVHYARTFAEHVANKERYLR